jgi:ABC-type nitrate/sulfonate/bicarbonate transport system substrate-binding protein
MTEERTYRRKFIKAAGAATIAGLAGCSGEDGSSGSGDSDSSDGSDETDSGGETTGETTDSADSSLEMTELDVLLTYFPDMVFSPMTGADEFGYFEEVGLDVNITSSLQIQNPLQILVNGEVDVVVATPFSYVTALARSVPVQTVFTTIGDTPLSYATMADSGIESISDWAGQTVGLQNEADRNWVTPVVLEEEGLSEEDITRTNIGYSVTNLTEGNVDVFSLYPTNSDYNSLRLQGTEFNLFEARDYTNAGGNCALASEELVNENPNTFREFTRAWCKACEDSLNPDNRDQFAEMVLGRLNDADADVFLGDVDPLEVERSNFDQFLEYRSDDSWEENGVGFSDPGDYAEVQQLGVRSGSISEGATTPESEIVDNSLVEAVHSGGELEWPGN